MRARYYSPEMRRFVNADILAGTITNAITLNRYVYANGNPAMFIDPLGLKGKFGNWLQENIFNPILGVADGIIDFFTGNSKKSSGTVATVGGSSTSSGSTNKKSTKTYTPKQAEEAAMAGEYVPDENIIKGNKPHSFPDDDEPSYVPDPSKSNKTTTQNKKVEETDDWEQVYVKAKEEAANQVIDWAADKMDEFAGFRGPVIPENTPPSVHIDRATTVISLFEDVYGIYNGAVENQRAGEPWQETASDIGIGVAGMGWSAAWGFIGTAAATFNPVLGIVLGITLPMFFGVLYEVEMAPAFDDHYNFD